ncbi:MAG TPA: GH25 family lysozyme [Galbitalea sp.]|jgi:hypothetical protein
MTDGLMIDVYPPDGYSGLATWQKFFAAGRPWCGVSLKISEGLYYAPAWSVENWPLVAQAAGERYGVDAFRGGTHYGILSQNAVAQADLMVGRIEKAGGFGVGDLWPELDMEQAENPTLPGAARIEDWVHAFQGEIFRLTGRGTMLYAGSYLRDNKVTSTMGCRVLWTACYEADLPPYIYNSIGWTWSADPHVKPPTLWGWQGVGVEGGGKIDGKWNKHGYPLTSPIGNADISAIVVADGGDAGIAWTAANIRP